MLTKDQALPKTTGQNASVLDLRDINSGALRLEPIVSGHTQAADPSQPILPAPKIEAKGIAAQRPAPLIRRHTLGLVIGASLAGAGYLWLSFSSAASPLPAQPLAENIAPDSAATSAPTLPAPASGPEAKLDQAQFFTRPGQSTVTNVPITTPGRTLSPLRKPEPALEPEPNPSIRIHIARTQAEPDTNLLRGYAHLRRKELQLARLEFEQTLRHDPNNTDALLALAAIAQLLGNTPNAQVLYQRAVNANPADPVVQAAASNSHEASATLSSTESRLKTLLAAQPESGPLNFSLANVYTQQQRWPEAQQHYFNAVTADGDNPDYLFNLAVSLDHLRQSRLAAQHYRLALAAAERRPSTFVHAQAEQRLREFPAEQQP